LAGAVLLLPNLKPYLSIVHSKTAWDNGKSADTQNQVDFQFSGQSISVYARKVLGKELKKLYYPVAFTGKVAKAIEDAGHEVYATDLSPYWVSHLKGLGLRADMRSFEDIPSERFDAVLSFEPYPVTKNVVGYLGMLRILSTLTPYIQILSRPHCGIINPKWSHLTTPEPLEIREDRRYKNGTVGESHRAYPKLPDDMMRQAYDYGARFNWHIVYFDEHHFFDFKSVVPAPRSVRRSSLDLMLLEKQDDWASGPSVSIRMLAHSFAKSPEEIAASLLRLLEISRRYQLQNDTLYYCGGNAAKEDPSVIRKIKIVD